MLVRSRDGRAVGWGRPGQVWGTYLHGLFDADGFRAWWLNGLRARKGLPPVARAGGHASAQEAALDRLALTVRQSLDMEAVYRLLGL